MMKNKIILTSVLFALTLSFTGCGCSYNPNEGGGEVEKIAVTSVSLNKSTLKVALGGTARLTATVLPKDATDKTIIWSSSDESVATVDNGVVSGLSIGLATITATTKDGNKTASCNISVKDEQDIDDGISYDGINLYYNVSDDDMTTFLNDFTHRNMRYDGDSVAQPVELKNIGSGTGFQKNWETMAISFQNSVKDVYREDKFNKIVQYMSKVSQDDQGLIYNTNLVNEDPFSEAGDDLSGYQIPQGWPFPSWQNSVRNKLENGNILEVNTIEFNFNESEDDISKEWHATNGQFEIYEGESSDGYGHFTTGGEISSDKSLVFYRDKIDTLLPYASGIDTRYAPMIDMEIWYQGANVKDYSIIFKVVGDDSWHKAPQSVYASTATKNLNGNVHVRQFFDMYLNPEWNRKVVTAIGVEFEGKNGLKYSVTDGRINFLRPAYDTRQSNATYQYILALYNYFIYTRDLKVLNSLMPRARKGLLFLTHALEGEKGLLSLEYLYGHDGVVPYSIDEDDRLAYHGISNGYWDLQLSPIRNFEANTYFYKTLKAMAVLEEAMSNVEKDNKESLYVKNRIPGGPDIYYNYDVDSINELAAKVKANMEKPVAVEDIGEVSFTATAGDYNKKSTGGFYNPDTGRFVLGINEYNGDVLDFGYVYLNLEAIAAGIGTPEQQLSIMNWIDGRRTVAGDDSIRSDIYFYRFAPRFNTKDCEHYMGFYSEENKVNLDGYSYWSRQCQDGGAVIAWSYYDLVARSKVFGAENALQRLDEIKQWYLEVLNEGGYADNFYNSYYDMLDSQHLGDDDWYWIYSVQSGGNRGPGALGLDSEFLESAILIRAIPDALFGMEASGYNNLEFTYSENSLHDYFEIYNMKYGDAVYSLRYKHNVMQIFNINGVVDKNFKVTFKYKTDKNIKVIVNGELFTNVNYKDGYALITVPFDNVKVIFG